MWHKILKIFDSEQEMNDITGAEAIAAILVRAAKTDGVYTESEIRLIDTILSKQMHFGIENALKLRSRGEILEREINDNVQLTRIIKNEIPYENRHELVQQLWQIIMDDEIRTPEENKLMRVLVHLLGINDVQSAKARSKALMLKKQKTNLTQKEH